MGIFDDQNIGKISIEHLVKKFFIKNSKLIGFWVGYGDMNIKEENVQIVFMDSNFKACEFDNDYNKYIYVSNECFGHIYDKSKIILYLSSNPGPVMGFSRLLAPSFHADCFLTLNYIINYKE